MKEGGTRRDETRRDETVRYGTVRYGTVRYGTVRYGTVRYGTVRDGTRRYETVRDGTRRYGTVRYGTVRYGTVRYGTIRYDTIRYDTIRYDTIRYDTIRYDTIRYDTMQHKTQRTSFLNLTEKWAFVRTCMRACVRACFSAYMRACVWACVRACVREDKMKQNISSLYSKRGVYSPLRPSSNTQLPHHRTGCTIVLFYDPITFHGGCLNKCLFPEYYRCILQQVDGSSSTPMSLRIHQASYEEDRSCPLVLDEEQEGVIGNERRR